MFRRLAQAVGTALSRNSPHSAPVAPIDHSAINLSLKEIMSRRGELKKFEAVAGARSDFKDAVKELTKGEGMPTSSTSKETLLTWEGIPLADLTQQQAEELAKVHFEGSNGFSEDKAKAVELWAFAAEKGSLEGAYSRALCLKDGMGIAQNGQMAHDILVDLAAKDYSLANYSLAVMLDKGEGVTPDPVRAVKYYMAAAKAGISPALYNIGNAYATGRGVQQSDQIALLFYEAGAEVEDPQACFTLGVWHYNGKGGLPRDPVKSFSLQLKAAQLGFPPAMFNVGTAMLTGEGVEKDQVMAAQWLLKSAQRGIAHANLNLAKMYLEGVGVEKSIEKAIEILRPIEQRNQVAQEFLQELEQMQREGGLSKDSPSNQQ